MIRAMLPYVVGLAIAVALFITTGHLDYTPRAGQLGPETWPRLVIGLMAAACLFEIARVAMRGKAAARGLAAALEGTGEADGEEPRFPILLAGGIALVLVYAVLVPVLGFLLTTFLFLAAFMYLGRYRKHGAVWATSAAITVLIGVLFIRIAYVSLPRGVSPFDRITDVFFLIPGSDCMTDIIVQLGFGFLHCLTPLNLAMLVIGIVIGLLIGVLPGLTLVMGVALALPFTYKMDVTASIVLLTAMYVSGTYGGAFTAILFRIPGEPIDVPMLWDGYTMGRRGQPAKALGWTLVAAFGGGTLSAIIMVLLTQPLANFALRFSSPEYFAVLLFGLSSVVALGRGSLANALISLSIGLLIGTVGTDPIYGAYRLTFGSPLLADGIEFLVVMVGAYGVGEVLSRLETGFASKPIEKIANARTELPTLGELRRVLGVFLRSTILGNIIGIIPGAGATIASFVSYGVEAQFGKRKQEMGSGIAEGIVAPQAAATASVGGALVPLLALGIPGSGATAVILGAFLLHGIQPGPQVLATSGTIVYTVFASVFLGLVLMCLIGYFAIRPLVRILDFPEVVVSAYVLVLCFIGALSIRNNITDLWLMIGFGVLGFTLERLRFPVAPLVLGLILGPLAEEAFMNSMISFSNDWTVFFTRPIAATVMAATIVVLLLPFYQTWRAKKSPAALSATGGG